MAKKPYKKTWGKKKPRVQTVVAKQSIGLIRWRQLTNNRLQMLEEQMLSVMAGKMPLVRKLEVDLKAIFSEEVQEEE